MENQGKKEEIKIVSRPSNEEIQEDETGNLSSMEEKQEHNENIQSVNPDHVPSNELPDN